MNKLQPGENIKIEDLYTWGKTHGLKKKKCRELIKGLIPEMHLLSYAAGEKLIGNLKGRTNTWLGDSKDWKPPMTVDQLIWRYAPEWATELRFGERTKRFIWSSVDESKYFGEPKQWNSLVHTKILSTKPITFFTHTASNPIKPFNPVVGEQCEVYNHKDKSWLCVTPQFIGRTVIVLSRGLQEYSRKLSAVKLRKHQPRVLVDELFVDEAFIHQFNKVINVSTPNVRNDSFVDKVLKEAFIKPKQSTATKSDLTKAEEELRALIAAINNDKRLL